MNQPEPQPTRPLSEFSPAQRRLIWLNKRFLWLTRYWLAVLCVIMGIYAGLPLLAPVLMGVGAVAPAQVIYRVYSPFCHQFVFRSWMFFGEQPAYPRARAETDLASFEAYAAVEPRFNGIDLDTLDNDLIFASKDFLGSETMGWKTALCQRDVAIYVMLALTGVVMLILFSAGLKVPYLPFWAYILIAIVPIGLDGFSQLFANPPFNGFGLPIYPIRESTPFLRTFTGALFGLGNAWLAFPYLQDSMKETEILIRQNLINAGVLPPDPSQPPEQAGTAVPSGK